MSTTNEKIRSFPRYSNRRLLFGLLKFSGWKEIVQVFTQKNRNFTQTWLLIWHRIFLWHVEIFAGCWRISVRVKFGKESFGSGILVCYAIFCILYNHESGFWSYVGFYKSIGLVIWGVLWSSYDIPWNEVIERFWRPQSLALTIHLVLILLSGTIQLVLMNIKKNWPDPNRLKKGNSLAGIFFDKKVKLGRNYFQLWFDPALAGALSYLFYFVIGDRIYGLSLIHL